MAVVDCKDLDFGPLVFWYFLLFAFRLDYIEDNCNPVFVCFSDQTDVGVGCKRFYDSKFLIGSLWHLKVRKKRACPYLQVVVLVVWMVNLNFLSLMAVLLMVDLAAALRLLDNVIVALVMLVVGIMRLLQGFTGWHRWLVLFSLLGSWFFLVKAYMVVSVRLVALTLLVKVCGHVMHIAPLRLINHFVWTLFLHHVMMILLIFLVIHGVNRSRYRYTLARCWPLVTINGWIHGHLLRNAVNFVTRHYSVDVCSLSSLLHHGISRSHLASTVLLILMGNTRTRCLWSLLRSSIFVGRIVLRGACWPMIRLLNWFVWVANHWVHALLPGINVIVVLNSSLVGMLILICLFEILRSKQLIVALVHIISLLAFIIARWMSSIFVDISWVASIWCYLSFIWGSNTGHLLLLLIIIHNTRYV